MLKRFRRLVLVCALGAVLIAVAMWWGANWVSRKKTEAVLSYIFEVEADVGSLRLLPWKHRLDIRDVVLHNPAGYEGDKAVHIQDLGIDADMRSLATDEPTIYSVIVKDATVYSEQNNTGINLLKLVDSASRLTGKYEDYEDAPPELRKKIRIDRFVFEGGHLSVSTPQFSTSGATLALPRLEVDHIGGEGSHIWLPTSVQILIQRVGFKMAGELGNMSRESLRERLEVPFFGRLFQGK